MISRVLIIMLLLSGLKSVSQNDLDGIRYSRLGTNGTSRYTAMGGAFGALGADLSCAQTNPAALGVFTKGEVAFGAGLRFTHHRGNIYESSSTLSNANLVFNNFGIAISWAQKNNQEQRHLLAFSNNQLQNFNNKVRMSGYTNNYSIVKDMFEQANLKRADELNGAYEGAAWDTYLLDTAFGKYFSFVDLKRSVLQTRDIVTLGRVNEMNFSYAYSYNDKFYFGVGVGIPKITYTSTTTHTEWDDKDSMKVTLTAPGTFTSTYIDGLPVAYDDKLGFNSLKYIEYFATSGKGFNFKAGFVYRVSDFMRFGMYAHSPGILNLKDVYYNEMTASFDADKNSPITSRFPNENLATYDYQIITPGKFGASLGFIFKKHGAIGLDYEYIDYRKVKLSSSEISDFAGVNAVIKNKYKAGHNIRLGGEVNMKPFMLRAGYVMQGSPFGDVFNGRFVRHTYSFGAGYRTSKNFFYDLVWYKNVSNEDYYMFSTNNLKSLIKYNSSLIAFTVGVKF